MKRKLSPHPSEQPPDERFPAVLVPAPETGGNPGRGRKGAGRGAVLSGTAAPAGGRYRPGGLPGRFPPGGAMADCGLGQGFRQGGEPPA